MKIKTINMDSITYKKLEYITSGSGLTPNELNELVDLMDEYAREHVTEALRKHSVVRPVSASALEGEQLATEAVDTGVWDGERCPRCKSVNLVDVDDHWTKCQDCKFSFVGG